MRTFLCCSACGLLLLGVSIYLFTPRDANETHPAINEEEPPLAIDEIVAGYREEADYGDHLTIVYPRDEAMFPPEIAPPTFRWRDECEETRAWVLCFHLDDGKVSEGLPRFEEAWSPSEDVWQKMKQQSVDEPLPVTILGVDSESRIQSAATVRIRTSRHEVGAPLFYREVNLPFADAVKDPGSHIRWRFGPVSSRETPPIVLEEVPNCANCHSFPADGSVLAMEIDSANDKASYVIAPIEEQMVLDPEKIITWSDFRREDNEPTFGLLPQISPNGRYVMCMVKDQSVFVAMPDLAFSQLFFPIQGILAYYDRETETFHGLPGADDRRYVHANPTWSPDGKSIVFARAKVHEMAEAPDVRTSKTTRLALLNQPQCEHFLKEVGTFRYDLYRIPFHEGRGGEAVPVEGASGNGKSNYFPKFSPDGKWIVFCQANSFMLLQPDSELHILPAEGGTARRMRCNTSRMNSWHSWSPNGHWLVFSSKSQSLYTQLFLTHIDEKGFSTPAVLLEGFTEPDRAANIPEFVNVAPDAIKKIVPDYLDDTYYVRSGGEFRRQLDFINAIPRYEKALTINPQNVDALAELGDTLIRQGRTEEAWPHFAKAIELAPEDYRGHEGMGVVLAAGRQFQEALNSLGKAVQLNPRSASARFRLGTLLMDANLLEDAIEHLGEALRWDPNYPQASCFLGVALLRKGQPAEAAALLERALELDPESTMALLALASVRAASPDAKLRDAQQAMQLASRVCQLTQNQDATALATLSQACAAAGRISEAIAAGEQAVEIARSQGNDALAAAIQQAVQSYGRP